MVVKLSHGRYQFICPCGGQYLPVTVQSTSDKNATYCFYCKNYNGKYVRIMENQLLEFNNNWNNKLNCKAFTTLRLRNDKKYFTGAKFDIQLKGVSKGTATVQAVSFYKLANINEYVALLDTGYSAIDCKQIIKDMYKNKPLVNWLTQDIAFVLLSYDDKKEMNDLFSK